MKRINLIIFAVLAVTVALISCAPPPPPGDAVSGYSLYGFVGKNSTTPAVNEILTLLEGDSGKVLHRTQTNAFGQYTFSGLMPGYYRIGTGKVRAEALIESGNRRLDIDLSKPDGKMDYIGDSIRDSGKPAATDGAAAVPNDPGLMQQMAGTYWGYSGSTESKMALCPDGSFSDYSESSYSGKSYDSLGNQNLAWGTAGQRSGSGRWAVQGTLQRGTISVTNPDGSSRTIRYEAGNERGCFVFNGRLMCYNGACK